MTDIDVRALTVDDLFSIDFMRENTQWNSFVGMTDMCADDVTEADYGMPPSARWDEFVAGNTAWYSWQQMRDAAVAFYMNNHV
jgi:hypothetical protein